MTKYTFEQINEARELADDAYSDALQEHGRRGKQAEKSWAESFASSLGIEMEEPKTPTPGSVHLTDENQVAIMGLFDTLFVFEGDGNVYSLSKYNDRPNLTEAYVVSKADWEALTTPKELTSEQVGKLRDTAREHIDNTLTFTQSSSFLPDYIRKVITETVNAARRASR